MSPSLDCRICGNRRGNREFVVREMFYGTREEFAYFECESCATLQAVQVPNDLSKYYPPDYLGRVLNRGNTNARHSSLRVFLKQQRVLYSLYGKNPIGWLVSKIGEDYFGYTWEWFRKAGVTPNSRILDVGCGPGYLLKSLQEQGFLNASGIDPFQEKTHTDLNIHRCELNQLTGQYDFIMLHHSLEHMRNPVAALAEIKRLCSPHGTILVRIPVANCYAWERYGVRWFQIDAPRHLVIPSVRGMQVLAERVGLCLNEIVFDSDELQFCCSEQYGQGIPLKDSASYNRNRETNSFTPAQIDHLSNKVLSLMSVAAEIRLVFILQIHLKKR